jgi:hypothetical protein
MIKEKAKINEDKISIYDQLTEGLDNLTDPDRRDRSGPRTKRGDSVELGSDQSIQAARTKRKINLKNAQIKISQALLDRLEKIAPIFDFTVCYVNAFIGVIPEETQFGELAHLLSAKR